MGGGGGEATQPAATVVTYPPGWVSLQFNWYTRRAVLAGIYNTTELVMMQDSSPDFEDTWRFLENRISDAMNMGHTAKQVARGSASGPKDKFTLDGTSALGTNVGLRWHPLASGISNLASGRLKLLKPPSIQVRVRPLDTAHWGVGRLGPVCEASGGPAWSWGRSQGRGGPSTP